MSTKTIRGYLQKILFKSDSDWGMALFVDENNSKAVTKIKGSLLGMQGKVLYEIIGDIEHHPKYGPSFAIQEFREAPLNTKAQSIAFFSSDFFPGIGKVKAEAIVNFFGEDAYTVLKKNPELINTFDDLKPELKIVFIKQLSSEHNPEIRLMELKTKLPTQMFKNITELTKDPDEIINILEKNFFAVAIKLQFDRFENIDKVALMFGLDLNSSERMAFWVWKTINDICFKTGNTFTNKRLILMNMVKSLPGISKEILISGFGEAIKRNIIIIDEDRVYTTESFDDENLIAKAIGKVNKRQFTKKDDQLILKLISEVEKDVALEDKTTKFISYDASQIEGLIKTIKSPISIITGGPGTGKTTIIKSIVKLYERFYQSTKFKIATPTGRAAARIRETFVESDAQTIHRMLKVDRKGNFQINEEHPLQTDLLIIDESSMIDQKVFASLLRACENVKQVVFVGDVDQLPSVSFGNVFEDIINSKIIPTTKLVHIHRQSDGNDIVDLAKNILDNNVDIESNFKDIDYLWNTVDGVQNDVKWLYEKHSKNKTNNTNVQVLAPVYAGELGIEALNTLIQQEFNPRTKNKDEWCNNRLLIDDKVMMSKNDYELDLSNGDVGVVKAMQFTKNNQFLEAIIDFETNKDIRLLSNNMQDIILSYACSIHKTQGSEYQNVVLVLEDNNGWNGFLNKKLIYTAITRAKKHLYILGSKKQFLYAINRQAPIRDTMLIARIKQIKEKDGNN